MTRSQGLIVIAALALPAPVMAQGSDPAPSAAAERRLSPEQIEAVLAEAARKREAAEAGRSPSAAEPAPVRQIEGEVGVTIGTGGYRGAYGTAIYPMGDDGAAAISLDFIDLGKRRFKR